MPALGEKVFSPKPVSFLARGGRFAPFEAQP
jgi:hypothetical protein